MHHLRSDKPVLNDRIGYCRLAPGEFDLNATCILFERKCIQLQWYFSMSDSYSVIFLKNLKKYLSVRSDQELADKLGVAKSTVSSWRQRDAVPMALILQYQAHLPANEANDWDKDTLYFRHTEVRDAVSLYLFQKYQDKLVGLEGGFEPLWWATRKAQIEALIIPFVTAALENNENEFIPAYFSIVEQIENGDALSLSEILKTNPII